MPNTHETLTSLFSDIADSIRAKTGSEESIVADSFPDAIDQIPTGGSLDPLDSPASASDIISGKEAYGDDGVKITGTMPNPIPAKGIVLENYGADGYPTSLRFVGEWTVMPSFQQSISNLNWMMNIKSVTVPEGVVNVSSSSDQTFRDCAALEEIRLPSTLALTTLNGYFCYGCLNLKKVYFGGRVPNIAQMSFRNCTNIELFDFSHHTGNIPTLNSLTYFTPKSGCVIKVPQALLEEWQAATNWNALTDVVWQGV